MRKRPMSSVVLTLVAASLSGSLVGSTTAFAAEKVTLTMIAESRDTHLAW